MKKTLAMIIALVMVLVLSVPCFAEKSPIHFGALAQLNQTEEEVEANAYNDNTITYFDNLSSLLLALQSGKIDRILNIPQPVAEYIENLNDTVTKAPVKSGYEAKVLLHMATLKENTEVYELLNDAIKELKENEKIEELKIEYIDAVIDSVEDPKAVEMPKFEGAETIKVIVTGDLPPIDLVAADGTPAGFNVALLAEIAKLKKVNIELVAADSAARLIALTSGSADAVFYISESIFDDPNYAVFNDVDIPETVNLTENYLEGARIDLILK